MAKILFFEKWQKSNKGFPNFTTKKTFIIKKVLPKLSVKINIYISMISYDIIKKSSENYSVFLNFLALLWKIYYSAGYVKCLREEQISFIPQINSVKIINVTNRLLAIAAKLERLAAV
jgi:hypothetical protein